MAVLPRVIELTRTQKMGLDMFQARQRELELEMQNFLKTALEENGGGDADWNFDFKARRFEQVIKQAQLPMDAALPISADVRGRNPSHEN